MCWTKNLFVFLSVAVRRRRRPPAAAARPPAAAAAAPRAQARVPRAKRADAWRGKSTPILQKMKRDCFFLHANIFQMTHSLQNIRLTKNISHNTASRYLDILRGMITYRHIQPSHKSWVNKSTTLESKGKILVGF